MSSTWVQICVGGRTSTAAGPGSAWPADRPTNRAPRSPPRHRGTSVTLTRGCLRRAALGWLVVQAGGRVRTRPRSTRKRHEPSAAPLHWRPGCDRDAFRRLDERPVRLVRARGRVVTRAPSSRLTARSSWSECKWAEHEADRVHDMDADAGTLADTQGTSTPCGNCAPSTGHDRRGRRSGLGGRAGTRVLASRDAARRRDDRGECAAPVAERVAEPSQDASWA
jgi:hypothetical protein